MIEAWLRRSEKTAVRSSQSASSSAAFAVQQETKVSAASVPQERGEVALELDLGLELAADEAHRGGPGAVARQRRGAGADDRRVVGEPEVVVRAQAEDLAAALDLDHRPLRARSAPGSASSSPRSPSRSSSARSSVSSAVIAALRERRLDRLGDDLEGALERRRRHHQRGLDVERGGPRVGDHPAAQRLGGDRVLELGVALLASRGRGRTRSP